MKHHIFTGSAAAVITPFTQNAENVDYPSYDRLLRFLISNNTDALVISGTTGESPVLTESERLNLIKIALSISGGKVPVIAGTGSNNTEETLRKSNDAEKQGVNGLMIVTPYYNKCSQESVIKHYLYIADRVSTPIIIYNVPSRTGFNIKPETLKILSKHKNICAVKEASGNISQTISIKALCGDELDVYSGNDEETVASFACGASGVISVAANIIPDIIHEITALCLKAEFPEANKILLHYYPFIKSLFCDVNPVPVKFAASKILGINNSLRLPLTSLNERNSAYLMSILKDIELI